MTERESMDVDVVVVGGGVAGLSAAIRLKQLAMASQTELSIVVLEKSAAIGAHVLSGAVIDPIGLATLFPDWQARGAPLTTPVTSDRFTLLGKAASFGIPQFLLPPVLSNHGCYIASLGAVTAWLGEQAEAMGIDIFPGFAATELLYNEDGSVKGVATGDQGVGRDGQPKSSYTTGMELHARYTLIAEGAHGSLAKQLIAQFKLSADSDPQHYGLGIKEVWEIDPALHREGHTEHTLGWPLDDRTGGGGFIYHAADNQLFLGFITHLNYENPRLSPFEEMQRWKTHPQIKPLLAGGKRIAYGARAVTSGGWQSIPELAFPGGALVGCAAGFMNVPRIKGSHTAILSAIAMAEEVFAALQAGRSNDLIADAKRKVTAGAIERDLHLVRNAKPLLTKFGTLLGMLLTGIDLWCQTLLRFSPFGTLRHPKPDYAYLRPAKDFSPIAYPKPDGTVTFDRLSSVYLANIGHDEDQPVHLKLTDPAVPVAYNLPLYDEPAQRYCPAGVYEIVEIDGQPQFRINAANCVHCKTCDIKDPAQNITWVPPEGGAGPNYIGL
ncbi:electron transfer flavoprotein-ubiquinone oxidoreductase [Devosia sp. A369]